MKSILITLILTFLVVSNSAQEKQPKVIKYEAPKYPAVAEATATKGEVLVKVSIDKSGKVTSVKAQNGHLFLRAPSEAAARRWTFSSDNNADVREVNLIFAFIVKFNNDRKNNHRYTKLKTRFRKPYRLELIATMFSKIDI